jgi:hypothetical protein
LEQDFWAGMAAAAVGAAMLVVALALGGCASMGAPLALTQKFDPKLAAYINAPGRASISGQAFVRQSTGKLLRAIGTDIFLVPRTPYADERITALYGERDQLKWGVRVPDADPRYEQYMRKTVAGSGGSFRFDHVADGGYHIVAMIFLPSEYIGGEFPIIERVTVAGGKSVRVVMRGY